MLGFEESSGNMKTKDDEIWKLLLKIPVESSQTLVRTQRHSVGGYNNLILIKNENYKSGH